MAITKTTKTTIAATNITDEFDAPPPKTVEAANPFQAISGSMDTGDFDLCQSSVELCPLDIHAKILRESWWFMIKCSRPSILCAVLILLLWNASVTPLQADIGALRVVFGKVGLVAAVGSGEGVLTFHGKRYGFLVAGASIGPTLALSTNVLHGTALNISTPGDLAGTYTGVGGGAAVAAGVSGMKLRNEKGVVLELRGAKFGMEVSANLALITITMK